MNTKATAPEATKPAAAPIANKAAAAATKPEEKAAPTVKRTLAQLHAIISGTDWTPDDMKDYQAAAEENKKLILGRKTKFSDIEKMIGELHDHAPITKDEFYTMIGADRAAHFAGMFKQKTESNEQESQGGNKRGVKASDSAIELFFIPKTGEPKSRNFSLKKGRIFERASPTVATPFQVTEAGFNKKLLAHGYSEAELMKFVSKKNVKEVEEYLESEAGQAEIAKIVEVVNKAREKLMPAGAPKADTKKAA